VAVGPRLALEPTGALSHQRLAGELGLTADELDRHLTPLLATGDVVETESRGQRHLFDGPAWRAMTEGLVAELDRYHSARPEERGLSREDLRRAAARALAPELFSSVLARLEQEGEIAVDGPYVGLSGRQVELEEAQAALAGRIEAALRAAGAGTAVTREALGERLAAETGAGVDPGAVSSALTALTNLGSVLALEGALLMHRADVEWARDLLLEHLSERGEITVSQFRELIDGNRRCALALLNRFDGEGITERRGDVRRLRSEGMG